MGWETGETKRLKKLVFFCDNDRVEFSSITQINKEENANLLHMENKITKENGYRF